MDFSHSEEQQQIRELARTILEDQVTPERLREVERDPDRFDRKLWSSLAEANLLSVAIPEEHGGMGGGLLELALLVEEVGRTVARVPVVPVLVSAALPLVAFGTPEQRQRFLEGVAGGRVLLTAGLIERLGSGPSRPSTRATPEGGGYRLDGRKVCVPAAQLAERVLVSAASGEGVALCFVDPRGTGVTLERQETTAGEPQFVLELSGCRVAPEDVLAGPERGAGVLRSIELSTTAALCAQQLGVCEHALRLTAQYTSQREQFGRRLSTFQAVAQRAANGYVDVEALRLTTQQALWRLAEGLEAEDEVAIAKYWAAETGHRVSYAAQHLHGGIGIDTDYPLYRYCLWAKQLELSLGSGAEQLTRLGDSIAEAASRA